MKHFEAMRQYHKKIINEIFDKWLISLDHVTNMKTSQFSPIQYWIKYIGLLQVRLSIHYMELIKWFWMVPKLWQHLYYQITPRVSEQFWNRSHKMNIKKLHLLHIKQFSNVMLSKSILNYYKCSALLLPGYYIVLQI